MIIGCYALDLYCDNPQCNHRHQWPGQFTGQTLKQCSDDARKSKWLLRGQVCICPGCAVQGIKPNPKFKNGYWETAEFG